MKAQIGSVVNTVNTAATGGGPPQRVTYAQPPDYNFATNRGPTANQWRPSSAPYEASSVPPPSTAPPLSTDSTSSYHQARTQQAFQWSQQTPGTRAAGGGGRELATVPSLPLIDPVSCARCWLTGGVGGVWGNANKPAEPSSTGGGVGGGSSTPPHPGPSALPANGADHHMARPIVGRVGGAASDGEYEKRLVMELCAPGGTRAVPPKEKLDEFLGAVRTLHIDTVGGIVLDQLGDESWQVRQGTSWYVDRRPIRNTA